jgi:hypothetical protein
MTGKAFPSFEGSMFDGIGAFQGRGIMAVGTQLSSLLGHSEGLLRAGGLMACIALHGRYWIVGARSQKLGLNGGVRVVAPIA